MNHPHLQHCLKPSELKVVPVQVLGKLDHGHERFHWFLDTIRLGMLACLVPCSLPLLHSLVLFERTPFYKNIGREILWEMCTGDFYVAAAHLDAATRCVIKEVVERRSNST